MKYIYSIVISTIIVVYIIRVIMTSRIRKKSNNFFMTHFKEDRLYSASEVAYSFKLDKDYFHKLLSILESYKYFNFFNKSGVFMVKDYYSQYEIKFLIKILVKKNKLK